MNQDTIPPSINQDIKTMIPKLWNLNKWTREDLPCNNPCSLMRKNIEVLQNGYMVGAKADGVRTFMLLSFVEEPEVDYVALVNRAGKGEVLDIRASSELYSGTLLDGEIVEQPDGTRTYFVFDIIAVSGYTMVNKSHTIRRGEIRRVLNQITASNGLRIAEKKWFPYEHVNYDSVAGSIHPHPCDGFIFVPEQGRKLCPGKQLDHFKWKRAEDHTIDFCLYNNDLFVEDGGCPVDATNIGVKGFKNQSADEIPDASIVECKMINIEGDTWEAQFLRSRPDKTRPNDLKIAKLTLQNVVEDIQLEELMN